MHFQKSHRFFSGGGVIGEAVGILKDAAADHKAVYFRVFLMKF